MICYLSIYAHLIVNIIILFNFKYDLNVVYQKVFYLFQCFICVYEYIIFFKLCSTYIYIYIQFPTQLQLLFMDQ